MRGVAEAAGAAEAAEAAGVAEAAQAGAAGTGATKDRAATDREAADALARAREGMQRKLALIETPRWRQAFLAMNAHLAAGAEHDDDPSLGQSTAQPPGHGASQDDDREAGPGAAPGI